MRRDENTRSGERRRLRFEQEIEPHRRELYAAACAMTSNPTDAEDLVQETATKAYAGLHRFASGTNARAWLYRILTNSYINTYRRRQRGPDFVPLSGSHPNAAPDALSIRAQRHASSAPKSAEDAALERIPDPRVTRALHDLPENFRTVVCLVDVEELSYQETARRMNIPIGTVMSRLHRGRARLRVQLADHRRAAAG